VPKAFIAEGCEEAPNGLDRLGVPKVFVVVEDCGGGPNGLDEGLGEPNGFFDASVFAAPKGLVDVVVGAPNEEGVVAGANGLNEGLNVLNVLFGASIVVAAKGLTDMVAGAPNKEGVVAGANGFGGAGEGDLLGLSSFGSAATGFANRTCLLLNVPREFPLPRFPFTVALVVPLSCSRFCAFLARSSSKLSDSEFSVGDVPGRL
jgi:hypothetical protein